MVDRTMPALLRSLKNRVTSLERRVARGSYQLPDRLSQTGAEVTDWNDAVSNGFYWSTGSAANNPVGNIAVGVVTSMGPTGGYNRVMQEVWFPSTALVNQRKTWRRVLDLVTGTWTAWTFVPTVRHTQFTGSFSLANEGSGPTAIPASTRDTSLTTDSSIASAIAGGFSLGAGLYLISTTVTIAVSPVANLNRFFTNLDAPANEGVQRFITGRAEDLLQGSTTVYLASAGNVTLSMYQSSGAARTVSHRTRITLLGGIS